MKSIVAFIVIVLVGLGVWWFVSQQNPAPIDTASQAAGNSEPVGGATASSSPPQQTGGGTNTAETGPAALTMAAVAAHTNIASCWTVIDATVYDLTAWIPQHPGGQQAILSLCGKDGTAAFRAQHGHAKMQENILASFLLGPLVP